MMTQGGVLCTTHPLGTMTTGTNMSQTSQGRSIRRDLASPTVSNKPCWQAIQLVLWYIKYCWTDIDISSQTAILPYISAELIDFYVCRQWLDTPRHINKIIETNNTFNLFVFTPLLACLLCLALSSHFPQSGLLRLDAQKMTYLTSIVVSSYGSYLCIQTLLILELNGYHCVNYFGPNVQTWG